MPPTCGRLHIAVLRFVSKAARARALVIALTVVLFSPRLPAQSSSPASDPLGEAKALVRQGNFDAALLDYQSLLAKNPKSPDTYAGLARLYLKYKDVRQAADTIAKGLQQTDAWPLHVALGEVEFRQGKIPEAEKEYVEVINAGHHNARAYLGLARVRWAISMNKSAKTLIDKAHELDPDDPEIEQFWIKTLNSTDRAKYLKQSLI
jgi:tetratricopeptide (TPR) repeat protein